MTIDNQSNNQGQNPSAPKPPSFPKPDPAMQMPVTKGIDSGDKSKR